MDEEFLQLNYFRLYVFTILTPLQVTVVHKDCLILFDLNWRMQYDKNNDGTFYSWRHTNK